MCFDWPTGAPPTGGLGSPTLLPPHMSAAILQEEDHSGGHSLFPLLHIMHTIQSSGSCIVNSLLYTTCCLKLDFFPHFNSMRPSNRIFDLITYIILLQSMGDHAIN